ncbi:hypothetical protein KEM48_005511 [Puccinia striiformis f. sp. tritici PST-130]|nr:hypothetical protein H4Q26_005259 [Puccinia striiformis f. sp. tritici PST-130]KAI9615738.1 hypothetical protein KEM48_005511 [Puccinia striiformis f. sp. tritici PST-130]
MLLCLAKLTGLLVLLQGIISVVEGYPTSHFTRPTFPAKNHHGRAIGESIGPAMPVNVTLVLLVSLFTTLRGSVQASRTPRDYQGPFRPNRQV